MDSKRERGRREREEGLLKVCLYKCCSLFASPETGPLWERACSGTVCVRSIEVN